MRNNKRLLLSGLIAVGLVGLGALANWYVVYVWAAQTLAIKEAPNPYQQLYDELLRPSVKVTTEQGSGSGVVIATTDAYRLTQIYILTAAHVVGNESTVQVTFYSYRRDAENAEIEATVVITDTVKDLALLRITNHKQRTTIYTAKLAPRGYVPYIFTPVWVVGASLGFPPRPTSGEIASATPRNDSAQKYWEINAPIWPGNSGGGVFLKDTHELIGLAVWVQGYRGQLATTMGGIVTLKDIYEFLDKTKLSVSFSATGRCPEVEPSLAQRGPACPRQIGAPLSEPVAAN